MLNFYDIAYGTLLAGPSPYWLRNRHCAARSSARFASGWATCRGATRAAGGDDPRRQPRRDERDARAGPRCSETPGPTCSSSSPPRPTPATPAAGAVRLVAGRDADPLPARLHRRRSTACSTRLRPDVVVLMELEVWPNFMLQCERRGIPVVLVNGRLTEHELPQLPHAARPVVEPMFRRLARACAQDETYAERFIELGAPPSRVQRHRHDEVRHRPGRRPHRRRRRSSPRRVGLRRASSRSGSAARPARAKRRSSCAPTGTCSTASRGCGW